MPVLKLYDLLYPEKEPLPVPDFNKPACTHQMAMTCIWIHLLKKAQNEQLNIHRPIPHTLKVRNKNLSHTFYNVSQGTQHFLITFLKNQSIVKIIKFQGRFHKIK